MRGTATGSTQNPGAGGGISEPDFVQLPDPRRLFKLCSSRFESLAGGNPLGPYLGFLARIAEAQNRAQLAVSAPPAHDTSRFAHRFEHRMPPLAKEELGEQPGSHELLDQFIHESQMADAPELAERARERVAAMSGPERLALAFSIFDGAYPAEQLGESLNVAAALQVHMARLASGLDPKALPPIADGTCPVCGNPPVASLLVSWAGAGRARYCCCTLCGALWNYLRVKCTSCSSESGIGYFTIAEGSTEIAVETCSVCRSYIKHFHQDRRPDIEPMADDIASFALDLKMQEESFQRASVNPLMVVA